MKIAMSEAVLEDIIRPGTTRGLDFVIVEELVKRTGITPEEILKFSLGEMLCNALDKNSTEIEINLQTEGDFYCLEVRDNGSKKLLLKEIKLILDFENKASSKRGFLRVSRGYLGNALKCVFGYSYALAESKGFDPPDIIVRSGKRECRIALQPDRVAGVIKSDIRAMAREDDGLTTFMLKFPREGVKGDVSALKDLIFATGMVNPGRKISYSLLNVEEGILGSDYEGEAIRQQTSALWYTEKQFESLFEDFLRARPLTQLKEFIPLFRGFTSKKIIGEILQELNAANHDSGKKHTMQFFPATLLRELDGEMVSNLFAIMRTKAKPISKRSIPSVLGTVGEESFQRTCAERGWERLRYTRMSAFRVEYAGFYEGDEPYLNPDYVEFPYLIELAVFDRDSEDTEGVKVYQCVNFMASMEDIFSRIFNVNYHLGRVGISEDMPVTVVVHLVCPVLTWLNYGKGSLDE